MPATPDKPDPIARIAPWLSVALGIVGSLAAAFRSWPHGLWFDEAYTARLAALSLPRAFHGAVLDIHPPTWTLIAWVFSRLPLPAEFALRLPSHLAYGVLVWLVSRRSPFVGAALLM